VRGKCAPPRHTASATGQQFVSLLLDLASAEAAAAQKDPRAPPPAAAAPSAAAASAARDLSRLSVAARCAYLAVVDLCDLASGEPAQWLTGLSSPVPTVFALEVVQRTLASHATLFLGQPDFRHLLHEHVCPLALKCMQHTVQHQAVTDWEHALRACHLTATLLLSYARAVRTEAEILLVTLGKMLEAEGTPIWQRALVLETFRLLSSDAPLLTAIFTAYDLSPSSSNALATLVGATTKLLTSPQVDFLAHAEFIEPLFLRLSRSASNSKAATFNTALYSEADGSHVTNDYAAALAIECVLSSAPPHTSPTPPHTSPHLPPTSPRQPRPPLAGPGLLPG